MGGSANDKRIRKRTRFEGTRTARSFQAAGSCPGNKPVFEKRSDKHGASPVNSPRSLRDGRGVRLRSVQTKTVATTSLIFLERSDLRKSQAYTHQGRILPKGRCAQNNPQPQGAGGATLLRGVCKRWDRKESEDDQGGGDRETAKPTDSHCVGAENVQKRRRQTGAQCRPPIGSHNRPTIREKA